MLHAVVEEEGLIPLWERTFEAACAFEDLLVAQLEETTNSIEVGMVVVADLLIRPSLILEGIEEGIAVHVDIGLLPEEALSVPVEAVEHPCIVTVLSHHLLVLELVFLVLELLDALEGGLADGDVLGGSHMQIQLHFIDLGLGLDADFACGPELALLCEEVAEEDGDGRLHLLEDVLVYDLLRDLIAHVASRTASQATQVAHLR